MLLTDLKQFEPLKASVKQELEISHEIIDVLFYAYREQIIIDLAGLELCDYQGGEVTPAQAKSVLTSIATTGNLFEIQRHWAQAYAIVLTHYNNFKRYIKRYLEAHPDQTKVIVRNSRIVYKDAKGREQIFV